MSAQPQGGSAALPSPQALLTDTDYENMTIQWNDCEDYEIIRKVGRGKYSEVFEGWRVSSEDKVIIKCLKPVRQRKIKREIKILQNLRGGPNVIQLLDTVRDPGSKTPSLVAILACLLLAHIFTGVLVQNMQYTLSLRAQRTAAMDTVCAWMFEGMCAVSFMAVHLSPQAGCYSNHTMTRR